MLLFVLIFIFIYQGHSYEIILAMLLTLYVSNMQLSVPQKLKN